MSVRDVSQRAVANLGWTDIRMTAPVFAGDTISASTEILRLRASASRPGQGIMTVRKTGFNQHGVDVCDFNRTVLIWKAGFEIGREACRDRGIQAARV